MTDVSNRGKERRAARRGGSQPPRLYHVTSSRNRESIRTHGLDWERMQFAPGIAGSRRPEQDGCFVCVADWEIDWFVKMNNTGGPVDVWGVDGVEPCELATSSEGHQY